MTDPYPWIPETLPTGRSSLRRSIYPTRISLKQAKRMHSEDFRQTLIGSTCVTGVMGIAALAAQLSPFSMTFKTVFIGLFLCPLFALVATVWLEKPKTITDAMRDGMIPSRTNKNIHDTYERINQIPGWDVVAAQDWAEMCDLADEAAAARSNTLTGPREMQAYNDAIRDYAIHIEREVVRARLIEKGAYTQDLDQQRAAAIRNRAPQLEQNND